MRALTWILLASLVGGGLWLKSTADC